MDETVGRMPDDVDPRDEKSGQLLARYRERLVGILRIAELESAGSIAIAHHAVTTLVDDLTRDIMRFYVRERQRALSPLEQSQLLPGLERLRDLLRHRREGREGLRDTLRKAAHTMPVFERRLS